MKRFLTFALLAAAATGVMAQEDYEEFIETYPPSSFYDKAYELYATYPKTTDQTFVNLHGPVKSVVYTAHDIEGVPYQLFLFTPQATVATIVADDNDNDQYLINTIKYRLDFDENRRLINDFNQFEGAKPSLAMIADKPSYKFVAADSLFSIDMRRGEEAYLESVELRGSVFDTLDACDKFVWNCSFGIPIHFSNVWHSDAVGNTSAAYNYQGFWDFHEQLTTVVTDQSGQTDKPLFVGIVEYSDYVYDDYLNWTSRKATAHTQYTQLPTEDLKTPLSPENKFFLEKNTYTWTETADITYSPQ